MGAQYPALAGAAVALALARSALRVGTLSGDRSAVMKIALINPHWRYEGSIYFGCRAPHLPLELGIAQQKLRAAGHDTLLIDAHMFELSLGDIADEVRSFAPDVAVITTAPTYLFWRCAPPELRVPRETVDALAGVTGRVIAIGPHASTTPHATLRKLGGDAVIMGEAEEILPLVAAAGDNWTTVPSLGFKDAAGQFTMNGGLHASDMETLPALTWTADAVSRHAHHHHRFDRKPSAPGAEMET